MPKTPEAGQSTAKPTSVLTTGQKRKIELIDPDTKDALPEAKRRNIELDEPTKEKCLLTLVGAYTEIEALIEKTYPKAGIDLSSLNLSHSVTSMIFTVHNIKRARLNNKEPTNMEKKSAATEYKFTQRGIEYTLKKAEIETIWDAELKANGLEYKKIEGKTNWIGTIGPYLSMMGTGGHRIQELRVGHMKMPAGKKQDGTIKMIALEKYQLDPSHAILLEGVTYPPERRSSMAMSLGPMTQMLQMITTDSKYRTKWESAVKRTFQHLPCIDEFTRLSRTTKEASALGPILRLYADLSMIVTTRHSQRGAMPLIMLRDAYKLSMESDMEDLESGKKFLRKFNCSGDGLFLCYKMCCNNSKKTYSYECDLTQEKTSQIVFHAIFGTYKEDLGVLGQLTDTAHWYTREEMGAGFKKTQRKLIPVKLPKLRYYSKLCSANQTGFLTGVYTQLHSVPCMSGKRTTTVSDSFVEHMRRKTNLDKKSSTLQEITIHLGVEIDEVLAKIQENGKVILSGTKNWQDMQTLSIDATGAEVTDLVVKSTGKFFLGRSVV